MSTRDNHRIVCQTVPLEDSHILHNKVCLSPFYYKAFVNSSYSLTFHLQVSVCVLSHFLYIHHFGPPSVCLLHQPVNRGHHHHSDPRCHDSSEQSQHLCQNDAQWLCTCAKHNDNSASNLKKNLFE